MNQLNLLMNSNNIKIEVSFELFRKQFLFMNKSYKLLIILVLALGITPSLISQNISKSISWKKNIPYGLEGQENQSAIYFSEANYNFSESNLPFLYLEVPTSNGQILSDVQLLNPVFEKMPQEQSAIIDASEISNTVKVELENSIVKKQNLSHVRVYPYRKNSNGQLERLMSFELQPTFQKTALRRKKAMSFASNSKMMTGDWYKFAVTGSGVHKLNYNFLSSLGIDMQNLDPRTIQLYGYGGGPLPEPNDEDRPDDMEENAILVVGESDGRFNPGDYILFYGRGQLTWRYDSTNQVFRHRINKYADSAYYFITTGLGTGKRIQKVNSTGTPNTVVSSFDDYDYYENDQQNLLKSGQEWYGELFDNQLSYNFSFSFPNIDLSQPGKVFVNAIARAGVTSTYSFLIDNTNFSMSCGPTVLTRYEVDYAKANNGNFQFTPNDNIVNVRMTFNKPQSVAKGWLNFIDVNVRRNLVFTNGQMHFRDSKSISPGGQAQFNISSNGPLRVWDITDHFTVEEKTLNVSGNVRYFNSDVSNLREFIAFNTVDSSQVFPIGRVSNQNLHGLAQTDMLIISHPLFMTQASEIKDIHESEGMRVHLVNPQQIFNEFSSGAQDPVAVRSLLKMFYDRANNDTDLPSYLLIVGDASYDFKDRINGNTNYVLSYQSRNSLDPVNSYVSDDYFALLDDFEGEWRYSNNNPDRMDVSVGRLPVKTQAEAQGIVNKIKSYYNKNNMGDWRNEIVFVGDDGDGVTHMSQSNQLAYILELNNRDYNLDKIFLDAYKRISTASGPRFPEANEAIRRAVQEGALVVNYTGHGGETGWAAERVLDIATISAWDNLKNLPVFMTATCEFSRFDDPLRTSGGELVLLNSKGGGIALMTTTRLVYSSPNYFLNQTFYNRLFQRDANGNTKRLGDVMLEVKNINATQGNTRNFSLLGDPALRIAIPFYKVQTTAINGKPISQLDTLKALSKATVSGIITDQNGNQITNFNGTVYPSVFDKEKTKETLNNTGGGVFTFDVRESKIFKGKASVVNGAFSFEFIIPKDISYSFGNGKISYYTDNGVLDGNGYTESFILGGSDPNAISDELGPEIELFMNDASFVYGGITDENPYLIANLSDEQGINTVGNGIGHDLVAILDQNTDQSIILNDYYEAETDSYQKGTIRYPMSQLSEGKHTLTVKAWDNANNSSEKTIEFNVVGSKEIKIQNLVNYPNPFTTNTEFIFQHNQPGVAMDVKLEVFTVSGKLVKSIEQVVVSEGYLSRDIRWNGRDDFGDRIGKGVYVYKLKVRSRNGSVTEKYEKLVIL